MAACPSMATEVAEGEVARRVEEGAGEREGGPAVGAVAVEAEGAVAAGDDGERAWALLRWAREAGEQCGAESQHEMLPSRWAARSPNFMGYPD